MRSLANNIAGKENPYFISNPSSSTQTLIHKQNKE